MFLGRSLAGNDVVCDSPLVSSYHLNFIRTTIGWIVLDLGSSRGTWVNSSKLGANQVHWLLGNEVIKLGSSEQSSLAYQVITPDQTWNEEEEASEDFLEDFDGFPKLSRSRLILSRAEIELRNNFLPFSQQLPSPPQSLVPGSFPSTS